MTLGEAHLDSVKDLHARLAELGQEDRRFALCDEGCLYEIVEERDGVSLLRRVGAPCDGALERVT